MKTTLDGVVFLLPHVSGHAKNGVSPQADFPRTERRARKRHAPFGRVGRAAGGGRQGGRTARWQGSGRQATRQRAARRRAARRRAARRQSSRTAKWQGGKVAGRQSGRAARRQSGRTAKWQDGKVAGRQGGRTAVGRAAEKEGIAIFFEKKLKTILSENHMSPHPGGKAASSQRTGPGAPPAQTKKTGETIGPARFSTGIPTAGSRRTAKKRTEKRPGICKRPTHRFSIRCSDTGKGAILSARPPLVK